MEKHQTNAGSDWLAALEKAGQQFELLCRHLADDMRLIHFGQDAQGELLGLPHRRETLHAEAKTRPRSLYVTVLPFHTRYFQPWKVP